MDEFKTLLSNFGTSILNLLPASPLAGVPDMITGLSSTGLGWLNWFFPVGQCLEIFALWLTCLGVYYAYSLILRWIRAIE